MNPVIIRNASDIIMNTMEDIARRTIVPRYFVMFYYDSAGFLHVYDTQNLDACHKAVLKSHSDYILTSVEPCQDEKTARNICQSVRMVERIHEIFRAAVMNHRAGLPAALPGAAAAA
jgi:hypothetical protein